MDNWRDYFDEDILVKGREYYKKGKVKGFVSTEKTCMARVLGTHVYNVKIKNAGDTGYTMSCDCPFSDGGYHCKHEAAVFFKWKKDSAEDEAVMEIESSETATYFNVKKALSAYTISKATYNEAEKLIKSGKISMDKPQMVYARTLEGTVLCARILGQLEGNRDYPVSVNALLTSDKILSSECFATHNNATRFSFYDYNRICVHKLALLLLSDEYMTKFNPGDDTDYMGSRIMNSYRSFAALKKAEEVTEKSRVIELEPTLIVGDNYRRNLFLSFKIGVEKKYMLKDVGELTDTRDKAGALQLGKKNMISFMDLDFTDEAEKYYEIIKKAKSDEKLFEEKVNEMRIYRGYSKTHKDRIELTPELIDRFYDASEGRSVGIGFNGSRSAMSTVRICGGKIKIKLVINKLLDDKKHFKGLSVSAIVPRLIKGRDYNYILDESDGVFSRIDEISPIVKMLTDNNEGESVAFTIGKKNLSEFYYRLLPQLMEAPEIEISDKDIASYRDYLPPECEIIFYMDADEDNITGRVCAEYAGEETPLHVLTDADYPLPDSRDISFEQRAVETLMKYLPHTADSGALFMCEKSGDNTFNILNEGLSDLMALGEVRATKEFERLKIRKAPVIRLGVSVESGILNLDVTTDDMSEEELLDLLESYRKKKKFYRLKSGEFIRLDKDDALEELVSTMEAMGVSAKEFTRGKLHLPLYRAIYINKLLQEHDEIASDRDSNFKNLIRNFNAVKESDVEVPKSLSKILRGYQKYGFRWLSMLTELGFGGILADDMGLGKTLQVIALLQSRVLKEKITALIVCPASLVYNWEEEFKRFAPDISVKTVTGTQTERKKILSSKQKPDVFVTSYDLLKRDIGLYEDHKFDFEIIDEAQYIKNAQAAVSKSVKVINASHRFALTGTPIENRLSELWSIFDFLMPGFLYTYERFKSDFETAITKNKDEEATKHLRGMVSPFILRRLKEDVLKDLPDKIEEVRYSRFDAEQRKLYDAQVTHMKKLIQSSEYDSGKDRIKVIAELTRIRQICCDPGLITEGYTGESAKRASCIELVESAIDGGHKVLLFSQFTSMFELLEKDLKAAGIEYYKITGQTLKEERIKLVRSFNENSVPLFLISLKAGGTGLNLVGADVVIHYDPWWNLAAQNQATDRAHRIGQTKKVSVFKLIVKDTIEEKIIEMQNAKKDLADAILSGESESLMNMSKEQLMELLGS